MSEWYPLEGWVGLMAERHHADAERGGCTCGFCAWSPEHVAIMAYRDAVDAAPAAPDVARRVEELLPTQPVVTDGMVRHDDWSHSTGLACDLCPGWPHTHCVSATDLRAALKGDSK